jgi:hypothetical protein
MYLAANMRGNPRPAYTFKRKSFDTAYYLAEMATDHARNEEKFLERWVPHRAVMSKC